MTTLFYHTPLDEITTESEVISSIFKKSDQEILQSIYLIRSLKYSIVVISEAMANTLQHILAKKHNVPIRGYMEAFVKSKEHRIISSELLEKLQPFFSFRNMLVHHYWKVNNELFLKNLRDGLSDFQEFIKEINILIVNTTT